MKNFSFGLIIGLVISFGLFSLYSPTEIKEQQPTIINEFTGANSTPTINSSKPSENGNIDNVSPKNTKSSNFINEIPNTKSRVDGKNQSDPVITELVTTINNLSNDELLRVERFIEHLNDRTASEIFESEAIDPVWSIEKQTELEYSFFDESTLKDIGSLKSIVCKTRICRVLVDVPLGVKLNASHYLGWASPVSIQINPAIANKHDKTIEIYISEP